MESKYDTNEFIYRTDSQTQRTEDTLVVAKWERGVREGQLGVGD